MKKQQVGLCHRLSSHSSFPINQILAPFAVLILSLGTTATYSNGEFTFDGNSRQYDESRSYNSDDDFSFAVMGDHTGGHRSDVLAAAVQSLNLLQPDFVMSVGDLIEGYVDDREVLESQWKEADELLGSLTMPFFPVPGNHDINFDPSEAVWFERSGVERSYAHLLYKNVLFLLISTEDPPKKEPSDELLNKYERLKAGDIKDKEEANATIHELETWAGEVNISEAQVNYFKRVLAENAEVRWTFLFMHSPPWELDDAGNFVKIEALLANRPYTVFAGHTHTYDYAQRNGRDYVTMGMTGGGPPGKELGHMDHLAWVSMTDDGPVIGNLLLNGILDKRGAVPSVQDFLLFRPPSDRDSE